jgi:4-amino-4-deoxy-L-arabinose transferase-like glycosyltransferase
LQLRRAARSIAFDRLRHGEETQLTARPPIPVHFAAALIGFAALLLLPGLGRLGALDSTDARYLAIAREMRDGGSWSVPHLGGAPHLDKPPLAYWSAALGFTWFGTSEASGRAAQQFALVATALCVFAAARRLADARWARVAPLVLIGMALPFGLSRGLATDLFQLALVTPALWLLHESAIRRAAIPIAGALALLGASMLAKGPIALLVVAAVWAAWAACVGRFARVTLRGVGVGVLLFLAIGLPWYALLAAREPGAIGWMLEQLASRTRSGGAGHTKDVTYLLRVWLLGLLPWTPVVLLAVWRLRPRGRPRDADPTDLFVLAWALAPVALFSLFATKLAPYVAPAFPGAALAVARAGSRGLLDDRRARSAFALAWGTTLVAAGAIGTLVLVESGLGADVVPALAIAPDAVAVASGALLLTLAAVATGATRRWRAAPSVHAAGALAVVACLALALGFHAVAAAIPTLREPARIVARVPGARLVAFSFKPSLFFHLGEAVSVAGVRGLLEPFVDPARAPRLTLTREAGVARLCEATPVFALVDRREADALADACAAESVHEARRYTLLANPAARRALAGE